MLGHIAPRNNGSSERQRSGSLGEPQSLLDAADRNAELRKLGQAVTASPWREDCANTSVSGQGVSGGRSARRKE